MRQDMNFAMSTRSSLNGSEQRLRPVNIFRLLRAVLERNKQWAPIWKNSFSGWERA